MVYVQTTFDLDGIGYSATLPTYRTVLRREHRLSESEDEHLRRCRACSEARPMIDWTIGHHGDRRAVVVEHNAVADLVGRPGATGMLVPMRFPEGDAGPSYTVQSLHDRDALVLALQNSSAPDYEEVFSHRDAGAGSSVWAADGGRTYLRGPLEETVDWFDCFFCTTYVVGSRQMENSDPVSAHSPGFPITSDVYPLEPGLMVLLPPIGPPVQPPVGYGCSFPVGCKRRSNNVPSGRLDRR